MAMISHIQGIYIVVGYEIDQYLTQLRLYGMWVVTMIKKVLVFSATVSTIKKLCDGLGITIDEFFHNELFDGLEQEIK